MGLIKLIVFVLLLAVLIICFVLAPKEGFLFIKEVVKTVIDMLKAFINHIPNIAQTFTDWIKAISLNTSKNKKE